jgi:hypothetical protein
MDQFSVRLTVSHAAKRQRYGQADQRFHFEVTPVFQPADCLAPDADKNVGATWESGKNGPEPTGMSALHNATMQDEIVAGGRE